MAAPGSAGISDAATGAAASLVTGSIGAGAAVATGFDASIVDVVVAIAAAAMARGCGALSDVAGMLTGSATTTGAVIATATGTIAAAVGAAGCADAMASVGAIRSVVPATSKAASFTAVFTSA